MKFLGWKNYFTKWRKIWFSIFISTCIIHFAFEFDHELLIFPSLLAWLLFLADYDLNNKIKEIKQQKVGSGNQ